MMQQEELQTPEALLSVSSRDEKRAVAPGRWSAFRAFLARNPRILIGIVLVGIFVLVALTGFLFSHESTSNDLSQPPGPAHWLGTNQRGEDVFAQLVNGTRVSLLVSCVAALGSTVLSILIGVSAGYFGGWVDEALSFLTNIFLVLPGLPLAIVIASFISVKGPAIIILVLLLTSWPWGARVLRSQTLTIREREYIAAARSLGEYSWRIVLVEILPNQMALVASSFVGTFIYATLSEITLEFLGLGDLNSSSWGTMLFWAKADHALLTGSWWLFVPPGLCVAVLCAGLTFINFGIDELSNPKLRREKRPKQSIGDGLIR